MRQKTDPVNILIAVLALMILSGAYFLTHRIYQAATPKSPKPVPSQVSPNLTGTAPTLPAQR